MGAKLNDFTCNFMPQNHWFTQFDRPKPTVIVIMQVGPTNAPRFQSDRHLPGPRRLSVARLQTQVFRAVNDQSFHVSDFPCCTSCLKIAIRSIAAKPNNPWPKKEKPNVIWIVQS